MWSKKSPPSLRDDRPFVTDPIHAYQLVSMLEGAVLRGTGRRALELKKTLAGKTGTTNDYRDALFIGCSPDLVVGIFVGFDDSKTLGAKEYGSRVALPIFIKFMKGALGGKPSKPFRIPPGVSLVRVDLKTGKLARTDGRGVIVEAFKPGTELEADNSEFLNPSQRSTLTGTGGLY
jgi:penicillin-binding protein 1A